MTKISLQEMTAYAKNYGFVFQGSEIYGGLANTWDYGPLGAALKNNIKALWWQRFIREEPNNVGLDSSILMNPAVWKASGHIDGFNDPLTDCRKCKSRHRADHLIEAQVDGFHADGLETEVLEAKLVELDIACPGCGAKDFTPIRRFNLMFKTSQGVLDESSQAIYLRPETAQGIFVNFKNVQRALRKKLPFGIGQVGKSFRNEITPGNFIFRTREFEQMELEFFCRPGEEKHWFDHYLEASKRFLTDLGIRAENVRFREHTAEQLSHYSDATTDIDYRYPWGFDELWGIASRTDFDLKMHQAHAEENMEYQDPVTNERFIPYVVEPALGVERLFLALLFDAYHEEALEDDTRVNLKLLPALAPYKIAVLPLLKKPHRDQATTLFNTLSKHFDVVYDESGAIGRRYRRQDAIGTPFALTVDHQSAEDGTYTLRDRDTMEQIRLNEEDIIRHVREKIRF